MSSVTDLGDQWERELIAEIRARRAKHAKAAEGCKPRGEYQAQILRIVAMLDRMIGTIDSPSGWIRVNDKLPSPDQLVVVFDPENHPTVWPAKWDADTKTFYSDGGWFEHDEVTHWMPFPEWPDIEEVEDDEPHCHSCQDTGIGTNGPDSKCYECPKKGGHDEP